VNQSDAKQVVELHPPVLVRLEGWLGAGSLASKPAGAYTLSTAQGISHGNYVFDKSAGFISFTPEHSGVKEWSYSVQSDGSLRDAGGAMMDCETVNKTVIGEWSVGNVRLSFYELHLH
jgi:hypothetical protein